MGTRSCQSGRSVALTAHPPSSTKVKESVGLRLYSPLWAFIARYGVRFVLYLKTEKKKINRFQKICGTIRKYLKKTRTDTQMKFCEVVARPTLLYGGETWVITKRDLTCLEAAEMRFSRKCQRIHKTRQNKKRSHKKRTGDVWYTRCEIQI